MTFYLVAVFGTTKLLPTTSQLRALMDLNGLLNHGNFIVLSCFPDFSGVALGFAPAAFPDHQMSPVSSGGSKTRMPHLCCRFFSSWQSSVMPLAHGGGSVSRFRRIAPFADSICASVMRSLNGSVLSFGSFSAVPQLEVSLDIEEGGSDGNKC